MKLLNSQFIVFLFGMILAQFVYAESVTLETNGLSIKADSDQRLINVGFLHCDKASVSPQSFLSYYRDADLDTARMLQQSELPVLVVSGSEDKMSADIGPAIAGLNKQNIQLLSIDGANHFFRDLYIDDIVGAIMDLMEASQ